MNTISIKDFYIKITKKEPFLLLDIRERREWVHFNIGGKNVPLSQLQKTIPEELNEYKNTLIVVACSGMKNKRGESARSILQKNGFRKIQILAGGVYAWNKQFPKKNINFN